MPSKKGSSRRKPAVIRHITSQDDESDDLPEIDLEPSNNSADIPEEEELASPLENIEEDEETKEEVTEVDEEEEEEQNEVVEEKAESSEEEEKVVGSKMVNGDSEKVKITKDEKGNEVLPDGTLVLQPEEVSDDDEFSGPEFKNRSKKPASAEVIEETFKCTSCHEQVNPNNPKQVSKHPLLDVLLCRHCSKYLSSGNFDIDDEGSEDQCRWCGEGGNLVCCDACPKAFCRSCIKTNLGRKELRAILGDEDGEWHCYVCNPQPLAKLQEEYKKVMFYIKKQSEAKEQKLKAKSKPVTSKSKNDEEGNELLKVMQLIGDKSASKNLLDNLVKGRSPKGLRQTLNLFKDIRKISEDLEHRIRDKLHDEDDEEESVSKSSKSSDSEKRKGKHDQPKSAESDDEDESNSQKSKKKSRRKREESDDEIEADGKKKSRRLKKTEDKSGKGASTSPSEDDVPGTSNGSVKGNKSGSKGRRNLFKAQQKERATSSSEESDEDSESESSEEDSDWEEDARKSRKASKKGKAGGKLAAKTGKLSSSEEESDEDSDDKNKKKKKRKDKSKSNRDNSDPEIEFPKMKKKKKGLGADSSNVDENSSSEEEDKKKKKKKRTKKSPKGDISLSSDYDENEDSDEGDSSADEDMKKIKKAKQNAEKGTKENKKELESDTEDKIAERLLMEEVEEEEASNASESSDSDLDDAKKKRDKRNKKRDRDRKRKKAGSEEEEGKDDDEDEDKRKKKRDRDRKRKKAESEKEESEDDEEDDDEDKNKKSKKSSKKRKKKHRLLEVKISESESEGDASKKKKKPAKKKKKADSDDLMTSAESSSDSDVQPKKKKKKGRKRKAKRDESTEDEIKDKSKKKGKRRRIKVASDSDSDAEKSDASVKEASGSGSNDEKGTPGRHRKEIRKVLKKSKLLKTTLEAELAEKERRERIKARRKELFGEEESREKVVRVEELVLEYGETKDDKLIEVDKELAVNLKPHQVDGVQFLWDSTFESLEKKDEEGGGAILAHCMGLGKTLQVITYLHTLMKYEELNVKRALVVAPLNTVLNWVEEFNKWLSHDDSIDVYEITSIKNNDARADMLEQWHEEGGVLVMGYSMYRILTLNPKLKRKRLKRIFHNTLVDPGPEVVVCDEGHMLKNDLTAIAKALNSVKTKRRICLTGTPLQNNLVEYHCMVNFVKPNLLGTQKEYKNRFVNPITNGQCSDSTSRDVRIMKHRAHILHDLLSGCVQRKDYAVITKFLPPKYEYVLSIRLSPEQIKLYEVYLGQYSGMKREDDRPQVQQRSTSVFADYQNLMRIWTHPQVLKLNTIREENRAFNDFDDFITSEEDSEPGSIDDFLDDRSSGNSDLEEVAPVPIKESDTRRTRSSRRTAAGGGGEGGKGDGGKGDGGGKGKKKSAQNGKASGSDSSDEDGGGHKSDSSLEIIKSWKTRSRTLDPEGDNVTRTSTRTPTPTLKNKEWYDEYFDPEKDAYNFEMSGKLILLFEILRHCEGIGEKILVFSQSLLSLDLIEDFLEHLNTQAEDARDKGEQDLETQIGGHGAWVKGEDYFRMDGSTSPAYRQRWSDIFNDIENLRARLFLISTKAGSLGINLVGANRVIIFDASWNPSHDTQSIFRVYRFGQERPVFIYRFVAQGTMEEKIYERQVAKQSLSQRVVDEHQIERHFSAGQLAELYNFTPDRLDDPDRKEQPTPTLPKDHILAELLKDKKDWIYKYHEHDSLLENKIDEELSEEDRKAAWEEYNAEKEGRMTYMQRGPMVRFPNYGTGAGATPMMLQRLYEDGSNVLQAGQNILGNQSYNTVTINGVQYRVPVSTQAQQMLFRQYQALQQQQQRAYSLQQQVQQTGQTGAVGNQRISQMLTGGYSSSNTGGNYNTMSNLLSHMSQQAVSSNRSHLTNLGPGTSLFNALKKRAEQEQQQQNGTGGAGTNG